MPAGASHIVAIGPSVGRGFAQRDPIAQLPNRVGQAGLNNQYADGMNLYQYVGSAPHQRVDPLGLAWTDCFGSPREKNGKVCGYSIWLLTGSCCADPDVVLAAVDGYKGYVDCWWEWEKTIHSKAVLATEATAAAVGAGSVRLLKPVGARQVGDYTTVARTIGRRVGGESSKAANVGKLVGRSRIAIAAKVATVTFVVAEACASWYCAAKCN
jgi:hypothetical protein